MNTANTPLHQSVLIQLYPHCLTGYLKQVGHFLYKCKTLSYTLGIKSVKTLFYLRQRHQQGGSQHISLNLQTAFFSHKLHIRIFRQFIENTFMQQPVRQLMRVLAARHELLETAEGEGVDWESHKNDICVRYYESGREITDAAKLARIRRLHDRLETMRKL